MFHHHHSPAVRLVGQISWLLTALAALAWGLVALGAYLNKNLNIWELDFFRNMPQLTLVLQLLIGVAGLVSLICWFTCMSCADETSHKKH